jgi:sugar fermentation stimulation protein A
MSDTLFLSENWQKSHFIKRVNRFLILCQTAENQELPVHLADSGRLGEMLIPGAEIIIEAVDNPDRKTKHTAMMTRHNSTWVSINSSLPNRLVRNALLHKQLPGLEGWTLLKAEYKMGRERFDFLLQKKAAEMILEVKGVSLMENGVALFPDAVTERGSRHLRHLTQLARQGKMTGVYFVVQRDDAEQFAPNQERDPDFQAALAEAMEGGVSIWAHSCLLQPGKIGWHKALPVFKSLTDING